MSNGIRWTSAELERYNALKKVLPSDAFEKPIAKITKKITPDYNGKIAAALKVLGIEAVQEYRFCQERRFRFDLAIPSLKIAIEANGGSYKKGNSGHSSGKGIIRDAKKANIAVMHGWKLFSFTTPDFQGGMWEYKIAQQIKDFINK